MKRITITLVFFMIATSAFSQAPRFMRSPLNSRTLNSIQPAISGNGNALVFMNDYTDDNTFMIVYSYKDASRRWIRPLELEIAKPYRSVMEGSYALDFEGETMLFSLVGGNSVGGYDLYESTFSDGKWSQRKNLGAPVNSAAHESYPSFSPDGSRIYFTRCESVSNGKGQNCSIMVAERRKGRYKGWEEPVALPSVINDGNVSMPRLLSDEKTLYFKKGNGDAAKWYMSRFEEDEWSAPTSMTFINATEGKQSLTVYYRPDMVLTSIRNERDYFNLAEIRVPDEFQPEKAIIKSGVITTANDEPIRAEIRAYDVQTGETIASATSDGETGEYSIILPEGYTMDYSIVPRRSAEMYYSTRLGYDDLRAIRREKENHKLVPISDDLTVFVSAIGFEAYSEALDQGSEREIKRLARFLDANPDYRMEINVYQDSIATDSVMNPALPLMISDTITTWEVTVLQDSTIGELPLMTTQQMDSLLKIWNDSLAVVKDASDTLLANVLVRSVTSRVDSVEVEEVNITYHNDFTSLRAQAIYEALIDAGVSKERLEFTGMGDTGNPEDQESHVVIELVFVKD